MSRRILVTTSEDSVPGSLRAAINEANKLPYATIVILPPVGSLILLSDGELVVTSNIKIINKTRFQVAIKPNPCQIGQGQRIFHIFSPSELFELVGIQLSRGHAQDGGAIHVESPDHKLILKDVIISNNKANRLGGGIHTIGKVRAIRSLIKENQAGLQGAGIWSGKGVVLEQSRVIYNEINSDEGGNGGAGLYVDEGDATLSESSVSYNLAVKGSGGGIVVMVGSIFVRNKSKVDYNLALDSAGIQEGHGDVHLIHSSVSHNQSFNTNDAAGGGGITITLGSVFLVESEIVGNRTVGMFSGSIVSLVGNVTVKKSLISANTNRGPGGGIAVNFGDVRVEESTIINNVGASLGGGIVDFTPAPGKIKVIRSQISDNILTDAQTIPQTIRAFLNVIRGYLERIAKQGITGPGGAKLAELIPGILEKIKLVADQLKDLPEITISPGVGGVGGGGIATLLSTRVSINQSAVTGNFSEGIGGGLFGLGSAILIKESAILKNRCITTGGGIHNAGDLLLTESAVLDNTATNGGGVFSTVPFIRSETVIKGNSPNDVVVTN